MGEKCVMRSMHLKCSNWKQDWVWFGGSLWTTGRVDGDFVASRAGQWASSIFCLRL
jgi:hypothetical protein